MIPKTFYSRLAHVELAMVAAHPPAVVWLESQAPSVREWEAGVRRLDAERGPRAVVALPRKAGSAEAWAAACRAVWSVVPPEEGETR